MIARLAGTLLFLLVGASLADATCLVAVRRIVAVPVVTPVVATPAIVVQAVPVAVPYPLYSVGYGGSTSSETQQLLAEVRSLRQEVQQLRSNQAAPVAAPRMQNVPEPNGNGNGAAHALQTSLLVSRCVACHDTSTARGKGNGFVLVESGRLRNLAPEDLGEVLGRLATTDPEKRMPRGVQITDSERLALIQQAMASQSK